MLAALPFCPTVERTAGGVLALSADGATVANFPNALRQRTLERKDHYIRYADIPKCLDRALISVEDKRFMYDGGIDPMAVVRVIIGNLQNDRVDHGGSTITQQLARVVLDIPHRRRSTMGEVTTLLRIFGASFVLEHDFSKHKVLELYFNSVYFGRGAYGVSAAARAYFGKSLRKLNEGQCIYLAGLPQAPTVFGDHPAGMRAKVRYHHVIATMVRNGYLTPTQANALNSDKLFPNAKPVQARAKAGPSSG